jgi:hypothetical protein
MHARGGYVRWTARAVKVSQVIFSRDEGEVGFGIHYWSSLDETR